MNYRLWKKQISEFKSDAKIKDCFHYNKEQCNGQIKKAHSLQKNGVLSLLEWEVNKNKVVYSFLRPTPIGFMTFYGFEALGKKECSTFHGFCDYHDSKLFSSIENNPIDIDSDEHCFLLSYRAFAKEYHAKIELHKGLINNSLYNRPQNKDKQQLMIKGAEMAIKDLELTKKKLNNILHENDYSNLEYFSYSIPNTIPIACAAAITPSYSYTGKLLNKSTDPSDRYENIMLTVLPSISDTHILFSWFSNDSRSNIFMNELETLDDTKLENAITSLLISDVENTFISPIIWNRMTKRERIVLMQEISITNPFIHTLIESSFFKSNLNLFDRRFTI